MKRFEIAVLPPAGAQGSELLRAVARGGELPVVDATRVRSVRELTIQLEAIGPSAGLLLDVEAVERFGLAGIPRVDLIVLAGPFDPAGFRKTATALRSRCERLFREVVQVSEVEASLPHVDGFIAKGNEASGRCAGETTWVLLQRVVSSGLPVWVRGGLGPNTAAGAMAGGASGLVLDDQLALCRESALPKKLTSMVRTMDGSEATAIVGSDGVCFRVHRLSGAPIIRELRDLETKNADSEAIISLARELDPDGVEILPLSQDAGFAALLAERHANVAGILREYRRVVADNISSAARKPPLRESSPLAESHGTRFPIVQGPMTRVSDVAPFARAVAEGGALPFLALALMKGADAETLMRETAVQVGDAPWGVGVLAFVPPELKEDQIKAILDVQPPFALIAGGRPDQAKALEEAGIRTYLHAPSVGLLKMFLEQGATRFIFEGRECGGHVGPLSSAVLWESAIGVLIDHQRRRKGKGAIEVLFAGGIHDARSAAMLSAAIAPMAAAGIGVGALMGTAYLFTREAVETGAIVPGFQREAIECSATALLEADGGHAIRCAPTPYVREFYATKERLIGSGLDPRGVREQLEGLNVGRLRIASKGVKRTNGSSETPKLSEVDETGQHEHGMYMLGQVASLHDRTSTIRELHDDIVIGSEQFLSKCDALVRISPAGPRNEEPVPIAIIGVSCLLPGAADYEQFRWNLFQNVDSIREVPAERWNSRLFFDSDQNTPDRIVSKWGGFFEPTIIDPIQFGTPPSSMTSIEPTHLLMLEVVRRLFRDTGYDRREFARDRTAVIIGTGGGAADLGSAYQTRCLVEHYLDRAQGIDPAAKQTAIDAIRAATPHLTEDSFAGILGNVTAGRIANRFDLGGPNYVIDAACASSLAAVDAATRELRYGSSDMAIVGGVDGMQHAFGFLLFSKTHALSASGRCRPFDASADGIAISEGACAVLLKRLDDAERDGDKIFAVIRGVGSSSDGRDKSLTAPSPNGQRRSIERAYEGLSIGPDSVSLVEAHGTGTVVGDRTELRTLRDVFEAANASPQSCALGSVKSQIGHTKNAAGLAGLIKVATGLHHRVLPPTIIESPNEALRSREIPFYLNTRKRPWFRSNDGPRRAGVSAFGFGGTNFHLLVEEYEQHDSTLPERDAEAFFFRAASSAEILSRIELARVALARVGRVGMADLADALAREAMVTSGSVRLSIVAKDVDDLSKLLRQATELIRSGDPAPGSGPIAYSEQDEWSGGKIAFLFPGQGSQYLNMLEGLAIGFPLVRETFERADEALSDRMGTKITSLVFPPPAFSEEDAREQAASLEQTSVAQPALGAADAAIASLLETLGIVPDMVAGHSFGEYVALWAGGAITFDTLMSLSESRGRIVQETQGLGRIGMVAVNEGAERLEALLVDGVSIAGRNAPSQTIVGGPAEAIDRFAARLSEERIGHRRLSLSAGFHIPDALPAAEQFAEVLEEATIDAPEIPVYSNVAGRVHSGDAKQIRKTLFEQLVHPVAFVDQLEKMERDGAKTFIEVGPGSVISSLARQILAGRDVTILATNRKGSQTEVGDLMKVVGKLWVMGLPVRLAQLFDGVETTNRSAAMILAEPPAPSSTSWIVDGGSARPLHKSTEDRSKASLKASGIASTPLGPRKAGPAEPQGMPSVSSDPVERIMQRFLDYQERSQQRRHDLMTNFLELQRAIAEGRTGPGRLRSDRIEVREVEPIAHPEPREDVEPESELDDPGRPAATAGSTPVSEGLDEIVLQLVSERTGYPPEMLDLDYAMEGDLGIDSIKRTEIFGALRDLVGQPEVEIDQEEYFIAIARLRTLREVISWLDESFGSLKEQSVVADAPDEQVSIHEQQLGATVRRCLVGPIDAPVAGFPELREAKGLTLVTEDSAGHALTLVDTLKGVGAPAVLLRQSSDVRQVSDGVWGVDLRSLDQVRALRTELAKSYDPVGAICHLEALNPGVVDDPAFCPEIRSLFTLTSAFGSDLRAARGTIVSLATYEARAGNGVPFRTGPAAVRGFLKCLAREWPEVRVKAVGVDLDDLGGYLIPHLINETTTNDKTVEVFYSGGSRRILASPESRLDLAGERRINLEDGSVVVATGGARGITAMLCEALAARYKLKLVLLGRSPLTGDEPAETAQITRPAELKAMLIERRRRKGDPVTPSVVESEYNSITRAREVRRNLDRLRSWTPSVEYHSVDTRNQDDLIGVLESVRERLGPIRGVIHGAGVVEDNMLLTKSPESFERVFDTKVRSALTLANYLDPSSIEFMVFMSSVAARWGYAGGTDYVAANEVMNQLAWKLDAEWPGRIVSIGWGPWEEVGIASRLPKGHFERQGMLPMPIRSGCEQFIRELEYGRKGEAEVLLFAPVGDADPADFVAVSGSAHDES